jgi:adenine phosphoribosyltransferase
MIATKLNAGFVPARKPGKLPAETVEITYQKEYGKDTIEIHKDAIQPDDIVLIHDDVLATGGTINAVIDLVRSLGVKEIYVNCLVSIPELKGWERFADKVRAIYICSE